MTYDEKRSRNDKDEHEEQPMTPDQQGVGARQTYTPHPAGGGGYQDIYTLFESPIGRSKIATPADSRLADLREIGMSSLWIDLAELVGFDTFMDMWKMLEEHRGNMDNERVYVPKISKYKALVRRRLVIKMRDDGLEAQDIIEKLPKELIASKKHILKIMRG